MNHNIIYYWYKSLIAKKWDKNLVIFYSIKPSLIYPPLEKNMVKVNSAHEKDEGF